LGLVLSGVAAVASVVSVVIAIRHNRQRTTEREEDHQLAEEQLALARQRFEMRPDLVVVSGREDEPLVLTEEPPPYRAPEETWRSTSLGFTSPPRYQGPGPHGEIHVELYNAGRTAANHVHGWFYFEASRLRPVDPDDLVAHNYALNKPNTERRRSFETVFPREPNDGLYTVSIRADRQPPGTTRPFEMPVVFNTLGPTRIGYSVVCDEGDKAEGHLDIQVPSGEEYRRRIGMGSSGLPVEELDEFKEKVWRVICEQWQEDEILASAAVYRRLVDEVAEIPDYAMIQALTLLQGDRIRLRSQDRRSEPTIRRHGGLEIYGVNVSSCGP